MRVHVLKATEPNETLIVFPDLNWVRDRWGLVTGYSIEASEHFGVDLDYVQYEMEEAMEDEALSAIALYQQLFGGSLKLEKLPD